MAGDAAAPPESGAIGAEAAGAYANGYLTVTCWQGSTGFRPHAFRFRDLGAAARGIGEQFLVSTRYRRADRETQASVQSYFLDPGVAMLARDGQDSVDGLVTAPLPKGVRLRRELGEVLGRRRSVREYTGDAVPLDQVATVLRAASAITAAGHTELMEGGERRLTFRVAPSPGGLYPLETWLLPLEVPELPRAVWRYDAHRDLLVEEGDDQQVEEAVASFAVPDEIISIRRAALVLLLVGRPWKVLRKYGDRGVRYMFIEAGAIAENVHLACGALGLGSVDCASVRDDELHEALGLDGEFRMLVHAVIVGVPA